MGVLVSKEKNGDNKRKSLSCIGYAKLKNTNDEETKLSADQPTTSSDLMSVGDAIFIGIDPTEKEQHVTNIDRPKSLSMTTQVSPKHAIPVTDGDKLEDEKNPLDFQVLPKKPHMGLRELKTITNGRLLGDGAKIRRELQEQGLLTEANTAANSEGIIGELRGVGILPEGKAAVCGTNDGEVETRRRLPARLTHLPATQTSLPARLKQLKFSDKMGADDMVPMVAQDKSEGQGVEPHSDTTALKLKIVNLETL